MGSRRIASREAGFAASPPQSIMERILTVHIANSVSERSADHARSPVFIVGPSRSGTSMLRRVLNLHSDIALVNETHYFDDLRLRKPLPEKSDIDETAVRFFCALSHKPYAFQGDPTKGWLPREDLIARAAELGGGRDAYFETFCQLAAARQSASIWGEKTPRHVFRIDDMLAAFPGGRVIALIRDPRAVVASYRDWSLKAGAAQSAEEAAFDRRTRMTYDISVAALAWRAAINAAEAAQRRHGAQAIRLLRYEDLVSAPEREIGALCDWLRVPFETRMLEVPMVNSSHSGIAANVDSRGLSVENLERWRDKLDAGEVSAVEHFTRAQMARFGYAPVGHRLGPVRIAFLYGRMPFVAARAVYANRRRSGNVAQYIIRRVRNAAGW